jgi:hypothetical protein
VPKRELSHKKKKFSADRYIDHFDVPITAGRKQMFRTKHDDVADMERRLQSIFGNILGAEERRRLGNVLAGHLNASRMLCEDRNYPQVISLLREDGLHAAASIVEKLALAA